MLQMNIPSLEQSVKQWMTTGLQDDKWIQLSPDSPKIHPWFDSQQHIKVDVMAADALEAYHIRPYAFDLVESWARDVAQQHTTTGH